MMKTGIVRMVFVSLLILGVFTVACSSTLWVAWFGLEITTLFFIPLLTTPKSWATTVGAWQYLVYQSSGSMTFMALLLSQPQVGVLSQQMSWPMSGFTWVLSLPLLFKMAMPPFQTWGLNLSDLASWLNFYFLGSVQKLGPFLMMWELASYDLSLTNLMVGFMSLVVSFYGTVETSIRRILTYSSLLNFSWCLLLLEKSDPNTLAFLGVYLACTAGVLVTLSSSNVYSLSSLYARTRRVGVVDKLIILSNVMAVFGVPPLIGFQLKMDSLLVLIGEGANAVVSCILLTSGLAMMIVYQHFMNLTQLKQESALLDKVMTSSSGGPMMIIPLVILTVSLANILLY
nr:NADH dehydrogenase subunit 2 [Proechinophthirus fluctus]